MSVTCRYYRNLLEQAFGGRDFILVGGPVVGQYPLAQCLRGFGAERVFLLGAGEGTGKLPDPGEFPFLGLEAGGENVTDALRRYEGLLVELPAAAHKALRRFDPAKQAWVLGEIVLSQVDSVGGRRRYGRAPQAWRDLEDKAKIDAFWDVAQIRREPSQLVPVQAAAIQEAFEKLNRGDGVVLAGDSSQGHNGGGSYIRWLRFMDDIPSALDFYHGRCELLRAMAFLEGIPCSIHGIVFADGIAVFRPVEMLTLRRPQDGTFIYTGMANVWSPSANRVEEMRSIARQVGRTLQNCHQYRGAFTIDGIMTADGFFPTEMNARIGAALNLMKLPEEGIRLSLLALAAQEEEQPFHPEELERLVMEHTAENRACVIGSMVAKPCAETQTLKIVGHRGMRRCVNPESELVTEIWGELQLGPSVMGGFLKFLPRLECLPKRQSVAPAVLEALQLADRYWQTDFGYLEAALDKPN